MIWVGFRESVHPGSKIHLNCRQCVIDKVSNIILCFVASFLTEEQICVNDVETTFVLADGLEQLDPPKSEISPCKYSSASLDCQYRAALEISRRGELQIKIPDAVAALSKETCNPFALPSKCRADVYSRYKKLVTMFQNLTTIDAAVTEAKPDEQPAVEADGDAAEKPVKVIGTGRLLKIEICYRLKRADTMAGIELRRSSCSLRPLRHASGLQLLT